MYFCKTIGCGLEFTSLTEQDYCVSCRDRHEAFSKLTLSETSSEIPSGDSAPMLSTEAKHCHYSKDVSRLKSVDVYRILMLYEVSDPCLQHAIKKLLCAGVRGIKDRAKDIQEAIDSLTRWQAIRQEDRLR